MRQLFDLVKEGIDDGLHVMDFAEALLSAATYINVLVLDQPKDVFEANCRRASSVNAKTTRM